MSPAGLIVRRAEERDIEAVAAIYTPHVLTGYATFEEVPPTTEEMRARWRTLVADHRPYLVAERDGRILGYAYAGPYRARVAYRYSVENSIYLDPAAMGGGVGSALLAALIEACERGPWRQMVAIIGDSANTPSIALHRKLGFRDVGVLKSIGFKHGRWVDSVVMQRDLGPGDATAPDRR